MKLKNQNPKSPKKVDFYRDRDDTDDHDKRPGNKRRPIRNWTKAYTDHVEELDDLDDFH